MALNRNVGIAKIKGKHKAALDPSVNQRLYTMDDKDQNMYNSSHQRGF